MRDRLLNKIKAYLGGYFWLPCPLCGQYFGGHEWKDIDGKCSSIPSDRPGISEGVCPDCTKAGCGVVNNPLELTPIYRRNSA